MCHNTARGNKEHVAYSGIWILYVIHCGGVDSSKTCGGGWADVDATVEATTRWWKTRTQSIGRRYTTTSGSHVVRPYCSFVGMYLRVRRRSQRRRRSGVGNRMSIRWRGFNERTIWLSCIVDSLTSFPIPIVIFFLFEINVKCEGMMMTKQSRLTFFKSFTFALSPSSISSFCPSRSSANLCPFACIYGSWNGDERPDAGGVTPRRLDRSRKELGARILGGQSEHCTARYSGWNFTYGSYWWAQ